MLRTVSNYTLHRSGLPERDQLQPQPFRPKAQAWNIGEIAEMGGGEIRRNWTFGTFGATVLVGEVDQGNPVSMAACKRPLETLKHQCSASLTCEGALGRSPLGHSRWIQYMCVWMLVCSTDILVTIALKREEVIPSKCTDILQSSHQSSPVVAWDVSNQMVNWKRREGKKEIKL